MGYKTDAQGRLGFRWVVHKIAPFAYNLIYYTTEGAVRRYFNLGYGRAFSIRARYISSVRSHP